MRAIAVVLCCALVPLISSCDTGGEKIASAEPPTCAQLSQLLANAKDQFLAIRTGPLISSGRIEYWRSTVSIPSSDRCIIRRESYSEIRYSCTWDFGSNRSAMGAFYRRLADRLTSCVGDVRVSRDDRHGYTSVELIPTGSLDTLEYAVFAHYERLPVDVTFNIKTR